MTVESRLQAIVDESRFVSNPAEVSPEEARSALGAVQFLVSDVIAPEKPDAAVEAEPARLRVWRFLRRGPKERLERLLEMWVAYLVERGRLEAASGRGGGGFYTLGSLVDRPGGWNAFEQGLPKLLAPAILRLMNPRQLLIYLAGPAADGQPPGDREAGLQVARDPRRSAAVLSLLGAYLLSAGSTVASQVLPQVQQMAQLELAGAANGVPSASDAETERQAREILSVSVINQLLLDPPLLIEKEALQADVIPAVAQTMAWLARPSVGASQEVRDGYRDELLLAFNQNPVGEVFRWSETVESAAKALVRPSLNAAGLPWGTAAGSGPYRPERAGRIEASIYSLPSHYFEPEEAIAFTRALLAMLPEDRHILILTDFKMRAQIERSLAPRPPEQRLSFIETYGRYYSPWPRDPFLFTSEPSGRRALLFRPPLEKKRRDDSFMAHEIFRHLAEPLRSELRLEGLVAAPLRFHVGHLLPWKERLYLSVHALEEETLVRQDTGGLPQADRRELGGALQYLNNVQVVAKELGQEWGLEPVFVHPFPAAGLAESSGTSSPEVENLVATLRAGGGQDLDSYMAILEDKDGQERAVVGSLQMGTQLIETLTPEDWASLNSLLRLREHNADELRSRILAHNSQSRIWGFGAYLDLVAQTMQTRQAGRPVLRLPLVFFPTSLLEDAARLEHEDFLVTWTNLVVEDRQSGPGQRQRSVELFSQGIPAGDRMARDLFEQLGYTSRLIPGLRASLIFNGGYRCASNHLMSSSAAAAPTDAGR